MKSKQKVNPIQWYSEQVIGSNTLSKVVKRLLSDAKIDGYFTNHSLRRSCPTRLFQAGVEKKIIKEITGHHSDALNLYEVTSEQQKKNVSEVLASKPSTVSKANVVENEAKKVEENVTKLVNPTTSTVEQLGRVIDTVMSNKKDDQKVIIRLEIELCNK